MITYRFFKYLFLNIKYTRILLKVYEQENIIKVLTQLFNNEFKKDWVGRLYAIFNPYLEKDKNDFIYEYNEAGMTAESYIEQQLMMKLTAIENLIHAKNLFELLTYEIKQIDEYGNYLVIIEPITLRDCLDYAKKFLKLWISIILILIIILCFI